MEVSIEPSKWFKNLTRSNLLSYAVGAVSIIALIYLANMGENADEGELGWFVDFCADMAKFGVQGVNIGILGLLLVFLTNLVRNMEWFDNHGPGVELGKVRDRIGIPEKEQPGDNIAAAIQWASGSLIIAAVYIAFFMVIAK